MKLKDSLLVCMIIFTLSSLCQAQDFQIEKASQQEPSAFSYLELNGGIAAIEDDFVFPGVSFLWGRTYITKNNFVFDFQAGLALPSIVTGKVGVGKKINSTKIIVGIRPFPVTTYLQLSFPNGKKGNWNLSFEYNPFDTDRDFSFHSRGNINIGYRWNK